MNSVLWDGCELWMCSSEVFREEVHNWRSLRRDLRRKVEKNDPWPETRLVWDSSREIGDKKRWRRRGRRRLRWEWWCEDPVCRMSQIKFLLLSCLFILQLCESNSTQKWGRLITFWMTPLYREPSKYVQKDPILCQTGFVANARHDYLGEPAQIPFSDVYIKEEFCNIDNREREKQFSVGAGKNPYSTIWKVLLLEGQD